MLVREGSTEKLATLIDRNVARERDRAVSTRSSATCRSRGSASRDETVDALTGNVDHFFHLAAIYDMTADEERNRVANVEGTRHAVELAERARARAAFTTRRRSRSPACTTGLFREDMFDEGQPLDHPYHRTKFEAEKIARTQTHDPVAGVPPGDRRRQLADRRDGQDRRAVLLLHRDQAGPPLPARLVPARRPRARLHEHRPGRLRRRRDGSHRASSRDSTARRSISATPGASAPAT